MNAGTEHNSNHLSVFLLGAILSILAAVDFPSLINYSVKAIAGGLIWLIFSQVHEALKIRMKNKDNQNNKNNQRND